MSLGVPLVATYARSDERVGEPVSIAYDCERELADLDARITSAIWATGSLFSKADQDPTQDEQTDR